MSLIFSQAISVDVFGESQNIFIFYVAFIFVAAYYWIESTLYMSILMEDSKVLVVVLLA